MIDLEAKQIFNFYLIILINDDPDPFPSVVCLKDLLLTN